MNHIYARWLRKSAANAEEGGGTGWGFHGRQVTSLGVDEAQDLLSRQIALFRTVAKGLRPFCLAADTAQAIEHGRGFSFTGLKDEILGACSSDELARLDASQKNIMHLTQNFRSHQGILDLNHALVQPIISLFKDVDPLKKEWSKKKGEPPTMLVGFSPEQLLEALGYGGGGEGVRVTPKNQPIALTDEQMIVVPSEGERLVASKFFDRSHIYTVKECKGLGREDVLLWNCIRVDSAAEDGFFDRLWPLIEDVAGMGLNRLQATQSQQIRNDNVFALFGIKMKGLYTAAARPKKNLLFYESEESEGSRCLASYLQVQYVSSFHITEQGCRLCT